MTLSHFYILRIWHLQLLLLILLFGPLVSNGQTKPVYYLDTNPKDNLPFPLTEKAFDKYVLNKYSIVILGNQAPVSGLKVETTKPSITLSGNFYNNKARSIIGNIELTGAAQNGLSDIFSKDHLNGLFKSSIGFNFLMYKNTGNYLSDTLPQIAQPKRDSINLLKRKLASVIDTAVMYSCLLSSVIIDSNKRNSIVNDTIKRDTIIKFKTLNNVIKRDTIINYQVNTHEERLWDIFLDLYRRKQGSTSPYSFPFSLLKSICEKFGLNINTKNGGQILIEFSRSWNKPTYSTKSKIDFINVEKKYATIQSLAQDSIYNVEIKTFSSDYLSYTLNWINTSILTSNTSFKLLENLSDNYLIDHNSFLYSFKFSINYYKKYKSPGRFLYFVLASNVGRVNTLDDISATKFSYKNTKEIKVNNTEKLSSEETGTAYQGLYTNGFGIDVDATLYWMPWKKLNIFGLYSKLQLSRSEIYINKKRLSYEVGTIWNINNKGADNKNLLSIVPFVRWSNLLRQYKDVGKTQVAPLHDLFTVGIQFGIPINIGK